MADVIQSSIIGYCGNEIQNGQQVLDFIPPAWQVPRAPIYTSSSTQALACIFSVYQTHYRLDVRRKYLETVYQTRLGGRAMQPERVYVRESFRRMDAATRLWAGLRRPTPAAASDQIQQLTPLTAVFALSLPEGDGALSILCKRSLGHSHQLQRCWMLCRHLLTSRTHSFARWLHKLDIISLFPCTDAQTCGYNRTISASQKKNRRYSRYSNYQITTVVGGGICPQPTVTYLVFVFIFKLCTPLLISPQGACAELTAHAEDCRFFFRTRCTYCAITVAPLIRCRQLENK